MFFSASIIRPFNFNSRPSARGDKIAKGNVLAYQISIHAPPRGATLTAEYNPIENYISIHAPPRGATGLILSAIGTFSISIHAPPRGATTLHESFTG